MRGQPYREPCPPPEEPPETALVLAPMDSVVEDDDEEPGCALAVAAPVDHEAVRRETEGRRRVLFVVVLMALVFVAGFSPRPRGGGAHPSTPSPTSSRASR